MTAFTYQNYYWYDTDEPISGPVLANTVNPVQVISDGDGDQTFTLSGPDTIIFNEQGPGPFILSGEAPFDCEYVGYILDYNGAPAPVFLSNTFEDYLGNDNGYYLVLSSEPAPSGFINVNWDTDLIRADFDTTTLCFLSGTAITTPAGSTAVEALRIGDPILTADGRTVKVKWVGRQTVMTLFRPAERLMPVRISAGALGDGLPHRDLTLTADHALMIDGLLINAGALVNGTTITNVSLSEFNGHYTAYHVETEDHDVILAEGTPAETYIDYVGRQAFDNHAEYVELYGEEPVITEAPFIRISTPRLLPPALKRRLGITRAA